MPCPLSTHSPAYRRRIIFRKIPIRLLILLALTLLLSAFTLVDEKIDLSSVIKIGPTIFRAVLLLVYWLILLRLCRKFRHRSRTMKHHYIMMISAYLIFLAGTLAAYFALGIDTYAKFLSITLLFRLLGDAWYQMPIFHAVTLAVILLEPLRHIIASKKHHHHHHGSNGKKNVKVPKPDVPEVVIPQRKSSEN